MSAITVSCQSCHTAQKLCLMKDAKRKQKKKFTKEWREKLKVEHGETGAEHHGLGKDGGRYINGCFKSKKLSLRLYDTENR